MTTLLLDSVCHQFLLGTFWTYDVFTVRDEAFADHTALARATDEAVIVPVSSLKGNETGSADTGDGLHTSSTPLGEQLSKTVSTVRFVIS